MAEIIITGQQLDTLFTECDLDSAGIMIKEVGSDIEVIDELDNVNFVMDKEGKIK